MLLFSYSFCYSSSTIPSFTSIEYAAAEPPSRLKTGGSEIGKLDDELPLIAIFHKEDNMTKHLQSDIDKDNLDGD